MQKITIFILLASVFLWSSVVSAGNWPHKRGKESPESIVTFAGGNGETVSVISAPGTINVELCTPWQDTHAPCITSLEDQGCKIIDVVVSHETLGGDRVRNTASTYLLSCDGR